MRIDRNLVPTARSSVLAVEVEGEHVLYDERTGRLHALNGTAALIWSCCDGTVSLGDLVDELADSFGAKHREVRKGVYAAVRRLAEEGLLAADDSVDEIGPLTSPADLGAPCAPCLAKLDALGWAGSLSVRMGELQTGVRATTEDAVALVQQVLAPLVTEDLDTPVHYSVVLVEPGADRGARELNQLYFGHRLVVRTRSRARALRALVSRLDGHLDTTRAEHLLVGGRSLVCDESVLLVSDHLATDLDAIEPRLRRLGIAVCDAASVELLGGGKAAVTAPSIAVDEAVLAALEAAEPARHELPQPAPGPRQLAGWVVPSRRGPTGPVPVPDALRAILATARNLGSFGPHAALDLLAAEVAQLPVQATPQGEPEALIDQIVTMCRGVTRCTAFR